MNNISLIPTYSPSLLPKDKMDKFLNSKVLLGTSSPKIISVQEVVESIFKEIKSNPELKDFEICLGGSYLTHLLTGKGTYGDVDLKVVGLGEDGLVTRVQEAVKRALNALYSKNQELSLNQLGTQPKSPLTIFSKDGKALEIASCSLRSEEKSSVPLEISMNVLKDPSIPKHILNTDSFRVFFKPYEGGLGSKGPQGEESSGKYWVYSYEGNTEEVKKNVEQGMISSSVSKEVGTFGWFRLMRELARGKGIVQDPSIHQQFFEAEQLGQASQFLKGHSLETLCTGINALFHTPKDFSTRSIWVTLFSVFSKNKGSLSQTLYSLCQGLGGKDSLIVLKVILPYLAAKTSKTMHLDKEHYVCEFRDKHNAFYVLTPLLLEEERKFPIDLAQNGSAEKILEIALKAYLSERLGDKDAAFFEEMFFLKDEYLLDLQKIAGDKENLKEVFNARIEKLQKEGKPIQAYRLFKAANGIFKIKTSFSQMEGFLKTVANLEKRKKFMEKALEKTSEISLFEEGVLSSPHRMEWMVELSKKSGSLNLDHLLNQLFEKESEENLLEVALHSYSRDPCSQEVSKLLEDRIFLNETHHVALQLLLGKDSALREKVRSSFACRFSKLTKEGKPILAYRFLRSWNEILNSEISFSQGDELLNSCGQSLENKKWIFSEILPHFSNLFLFTKDILGSAYRLDWTKHLTRQASLQVKNSKQLSSSYIRFLKEFLEKEENLEKKCEAIVNAYLELYSNEEITAFLEDGFFLKEEYLPTLQSFLKENLDLKQRVVSVLSSRVSSLSREGKPILAYRILKFSAQASTSEISLPQIDELLSGCVQSPQKKENLIKKAVEESSDLSRILAHVHASPYPVEWTRELVKQASRLQEVQKLDLLSALTEMEIKNPGEAYKNAEAVLGKMNLTQALNASNFRFSDIQNLFSFLKKANLAHQAAQPLLRSLERFKGAPARREFEWSLFPFLAPDQKTDFLEDLSLDPNNYVNLYEKEDLYEDLSFYSEKDAKLKAEPEYSLKDAQKGFRLLRQRPKTLEKYIGAVLHKDLLFSVEDLSLIEPYVSDFTEKFFVEKVGRLGQVFLDNPNAKDLESYVCFFKSLDLLNRFPEIYLWFSAISAKYLSPLSKSIEVKLKTLKEIRDLLSKHIKSEEDQVAYIEIALIIADKLKDKSFVLNAFQQCEAGVIEALDIRSFQAPYQALCLEGLATRLEGNLYDPEVWEALKTLLAILPFDARLEDVYCSLANSMTAFSNVISTKILGRELEDEISDEVLNDLSEKVSICATLLTNCFKKKSELFAKELRKRLFRDVQMIRLECCALLDAAKKRRELTGVHLSNSRETKACLEFVRDLNCKEGEVVSTLKQNEIPVDAVDHLLDLCSLYDRSQGSYLRKDVINHINLLNQNPVDLFNELKSGDEDPLLFFGKSKLLIDGLALTLEIESLKVGGREKNYRKSELIHFFVGQLTSVPQGNFPFFNSFERLLRLIEKHVSDQSVKAELEIFMAQKAEQEFAASLTLINWFFTQDQTFKERAISFVLRMQQMNLRGMMNHLPHLEEFIYSLSARLASFSVDTGVNLSNSLSTLIGHALESKDEKIKTKLLTYYVELGKRITLEESWRLFHLCKLQVETGVRLSFFKTEDLVDRGIPNVRSQMLGLGSGKN